jgi:hypothetical protein
MKIPSILFGTGKEVHPHVTRWVKRIGKEQQCPEIPENEMVETAELHPDGKPPCAMFEFNPSEGALQRIRFYAPSRYFKPDLRDKAQFWIDQNLFFDALVTSPWGILCLIAPGGYIPDIKRDPNRAILFYESLVKYWDVYLDSKEIFYRPSSIEDVGDYFWCNSDTHLWPALVEAGLPVEVLQSMPPKKFHDRQVVEWIKEYVLEPNGVNADGA